SDKLGQVSYGENQQEVFLGHSVAQSKNVSEATAQTIDAEIHRLIDEAYDSATKILKRKKKDWETLSQGLLEYETLSGEEIADLLSGKPPRRDQGDDTPPARGGAVPSAGKKSRGSKGGDEAGDLEPQPQ
ncbi:MAG: cell division protein FtsH, partial [Nitratireductor sp.]|nr:cell division protein FtsH [Nitratireductor sp.]